MTTTRMAKSTRDEFEKAAAESSQQRYLLRLYIAGVTPKSRVATDNVKRLCEEHLKGRYELDIIDMYQQPRLAKGEQILAVPTLIKKLPAPLRRLIGDMSDEEKFLVGMDLRPKKAL